MSRPLPRPALLCLLACGLAGIGLPERARAADTWSTPFTGVRYLYRTTSKPWRIHVLQVNLCAAGISIRATASSERKKTVPSFATLVGAEVAINGDFFSYSTYAPSGMAVGAGKPWGGADASWRGLLGFGKDRAEFDGPGTTLGAAPGWLKEGVSGYPYLVVDGKAVTSFSRTDCPVRHPRTATGLSRDRKTLYLAVVDGRWSASVGMTCTELAQLMHGLGAFEAVNFDGGGSSTMWIKGRGVVNHPSDGTPRVVANHLAVHAHGTGAPGSCDQTIEELDLQVANYDAPASSDTDGDGRADACARSAAGWSCWLSSGSAFGAALPGPKLADASGWNDRTNFGTIRMGDIDGDGRADLCARANDAVYCWPATSSGFGAGIAGPKLADASGYGLQRFASTIRLADFNGDGKADLCVRSASDFRCYPSTGTGFGAAVIGPKLSDAAGWDAPSCYGTLRMGDLNGDGKADLCGRCSAGVSCWLSKGTSFGAAIAGPAWTDASGWSSLRFFSTMRLADLDGDGKADLCARTANDFRCLISTGSGFGATIIGPKISDASGWGDYDHFSTIRMADVNGDGKADLCARGGGGMLCWPSLGNGFGAAITGPALSDASGWSAPQHFRTIRTGDIDRDGKADLCARSSAGLSCWISNGTGFPQKVVGPAWSNAASWDKDLYYSTIRLAGPPCLKSVEICDGKDNDCDGAVDEDGVCRDGGPAPQPDLGAAPSADAAEVPSGDGWWWGDQAVADAEPWFELGAGDGGSASGGCGCDAALAGNQESWWPAALLLLGLGVLARRRRGAGVSRARRAPPAGRPRW